jgi:CheY-like chemotaxis protein
MPFKMRLLVVEDDQAAIKEWEKLIDRHNAKENVNFEISHKIAQTYDEANELIALGDFDAAIVDLRLKVQDKGGQHNVDGNKVTALLATSEMAAIAIYTGQPEEATIPAQSTNIKVISKDDGYEIVMEWLEEQSHLIEYIQYVGKEIDSKMATIFHRSIWPRWKNWTTNSQFTGENNQLLKTALTRHFVSHLQAELLEYNQAGVHPEECYFVPAISSQTISTGDMIKNDGGEVEIIITPRCDIAHDGKSETIQLAACENMANEWAEIIKKSQSKDQKEIEAANNKIRSWYQHRSKNVLHFLPQMINKDGVAEGPWFVRFDSIHSEKKDNILLQKLNSQRFATVAPDFLPSLVERLGGYFSRIGTPDLST